MRAMILAAGEGRRMRPLTDSVPKPLLPLAGRPIIEHSLQKLVAAGVSQIVINVSWLGEQIVEYFGNGKRCGASIEWSREATPLETAGAVVKALPLLGDEPFILINGDIWCDYPIENLAGRAAQLTPQQSAHLVMVDNPPHHPAGDFAITNGQLALPNNGGALTFSGISVWRPQAFQSLPYSSTAPLPLREVLLPLLSKGGVAGEYWQGQWCDIGTPERLAEINRKLSSD